MKRSRKEPVTTLRVLDAINDDISISMVEIILNNSENTSDTLIEKLKLTHRQYYFRIVKLLKTGIVGSKSKKYFITSFGKLIYHAHSKIVIAVAHLSTLRIIDVIMDMDISGDDYRNAIGELIQEAELKNILLKSNVMQR